MEIKDFIRYARADEFGQFIEKVNENGKTQKILDIRDWSSIRKMFQIEGTRRYDNEESTVYQIKLCKWIEEAINEKIEKETYKTV